VDNIKMDLREMGWDWINLSQEREQWRALVKTVMKFRFHKMLGSSWVAAQLAASQEGLCSVSDDICTLFTVAARSKAWTVFPRSNTAIMGSNPTQGMGICVRLFCVCVALWVGSGLATDWSPVQGVLPCKKDYETAEKARAQQRAVVTD
jgi:hypothetical protein